MAKYLNPELVCRSFERLSSRTLTGKTHLERTSVLMYFLSVDAACKHIGVSVLDLNPDTLEGKNNRKQVELEFIKLVLIGNTHNGPKQVIELGKIDEAGTDPEKRISSNFLTVPLKKASGQIEPYCYPRRPAAPVLKMGPAATGMKWGIGYHDDWMSNFLVLQTTIKSPTPLLDLAVFICRDCLFDESPEDLFYALGKQLRKRFTKSLADFWVSRMDKEKVLARHADNPFTDHYSSFEKNCKKPPEAGKRYDQMKKSELIDRIHELESMLGIKEQTVQ